MSYSIDRTFVQIIDGKEVSIHCVASMDKPDGEIKFEKLEVNGKELQLSKPEDISKKYENFDATEFKAYLEKLAKPFNATVIKQNNFITIKNISTEDANSLISQLPGKQLPRRWESYYLNNRQIIFIPRSHTRTIKWLRRSHTR